MLKKIISIFLSLASTVACLSLISLPSAQAVTVTPSGTCSASYTTVSGSPDATILESVTAGNTYCILVFKSTDESSPAVVNWTAPNGVNSFQTLLVGGGGSGGAGRGGGGGAGELVETEIPTDSPSFTLTVGKGGNAVSSGLGITGDSTTISSSYIRRQVRGGGGGGSHSGTGNINIDKGLSGGSGGGSGMNYSTYSFSGGVTATLAVGLGNDGGGAYRCATGSLNDQIRVTGGGGGAGSAGVSGGNCGSNPATFLSNSCIQSDCYGAASPAGGSGKESNLLNGVNASFSYSRNLFAAGGGGALGLSGTESCGTNYCSFPSGYTNGDRSSGGPGGSASLGGAGAGVTGNGVAGTASTGSGGGGAATGTSGRGGSGVIAIKYLLPKTSLSAPTIPVSTSQQNATFSSNVANPSGLTRQKQWEASSDGVNWSSVTGGSGATSDTFTTSTLSVLSNNGQYYRLKFVDSMSVSNINGGTSTISTTSYTSSAQLTVNKAAQSNFSLSTLSGTYLTDLKLGTTGGNGAGAVSFSVTSSNAANCSITNVDSLTSTSAGTCQVVATKAETSEFLPTSDTQTITLGKASLQLTATVSGSSIIKYGGTTSASFTTNRSLGTGSIAPRSGTISYSATGNACSVDSSLGSISMNRASGTCSISVSLSGDSNYSDTSSATITLTAAKADTLTVTASALTLTYNGSSQNIPYAYSISGLKFSDTVTALSYSYSGTSNASNSISGTTSITAAGTYTVTPSAASLSNSDSYTAISYATGTLTVNRAARTIAGSATGTVKYGSQETLTVTTVPSSNSDGLQNFTSGASTACSVGSSTGVVTMNRAAGSCSIIPSIAQGANYLAATGDAVSVTPAKADAISVTAADKSSTYTGSASTITPTYSVSGLKFSDTVTVTYNYSGTANSGATYPLSATTPTNAGVYSIVPNVTLTNSDSYTSPSANTNNGTLTISRAARTLSSSTYNSNLLKYGDTATVTSNVTSPSSNSDGSFSYIVGSSCSINSSTGLITATKYSGSCLETTTVTQGNNYETATATAVTFTLSKADTITVTTATPSTLTYTGSSAVVTPSIAVSGLVAGDSATGATFNFSRTPTCAQGGACQVGDTGPGGGKVFYVSGSAINAVAGISGGGIYLEMAPATFTKTTYKWCLGPANPNTTLFGATATAIGTGAANTKIMIDNCSGGAGFEAANLTLGGQSDWFLPSFSELSEIYAKRNMLGLGSGTAAAGYVYWSSTESTYMFAASLVPWAGVGAQNKDQATPYLPIRAFSSTVSTYSASVTPPTNAGSYAITPSALTLGSGVTTDYYKATLYETATLTINKASQAAFTSYQTLLGIFGTAFTIYTFGGSGDGVETVTATNGTATGCVLSGTVLTVAAAGTCVITATKATSENYLEASSTFSVILYYFVPEAAAPVSNTPTQIAVAISNGWSLNPSIGPTITGISPTSGPVGTVVTISGTGMDGVDTIRIGRKNLTSVTGISSTSVSGVIPVGAATGPILVSNSLGSHFDASGFTVTP